MLDKQLRLNFTNRPQLVPINEATIYDIPTSLVELATAIKRGFEGNIADAVVILHERLPNGGYKINSKMYGYNTRSKGVEMCEYTKLKMLGQVK